LTNKYFVIRKTGQLTDAHFSGFIAALFADFKVQKTKRQLKASRENVGNKTAKGDDPTPTSLGVVVLTKCGRFPMIS
jgi:hypothetical protein